MKKRNFKVTKKEIRKFEKLALGYERPWEYISRSAKLLEDIKLYEGSYGMIGFGQLMKLVDAWEEESLSPDSGDTK